MTRLPIVTAKTLEKVLLDLGFERVNKQAAMCSTAIRIAEPQPYLIILGAISPALFSGRFSGRSIWA